MKRLKKILKWVGIVAGAGIALLLMLNAYFAWTTGIRLESRLAAMRQAGEPVRLADLAREPIPPEKNAAVYLRRAGDDLDAIQNELIGYYPKSGYPTGPISPADQEKLEKLFAAYPKVIPLVEQAADCPDYDPQIDGTLPTTGFLGPNMERIGKHRLVNRVLKARTALLLAKGRTDEALGTQLLTLRLTRHWRGEPLIIGYFVTAACETGAMDSVNQVLHAGPISPASRRALDAELALHDTMDGYKQALRSERAYSLTAVRELPPSRFWLTRGLADDVMLRLLDLYDRYLRAASRPYTQAASVQNSASGWRGAWNPYVALVTLLEPALAQSREPAERVQAMSRSLRVLNAIQSQVHSGSDSMPKLRELGLRSEVTIDPYNSMPLHLKKLPAGWMVYSVGRNLVDDGGILDFKNDIGAGPIKREEPTLKP